ncbi:MAG: hypothetical protein F8N36_07890 [Desulfovibrio sp.]|uniref:hypothetical protein n=1 Tax=Desulfovibrio sp. TaxID=885 RepID=UPI00135EA057|nr:hypothetical protein [Desulfovibrio sp.]MTJ92768.1 hypothetical protein [Desulfovibrio sp.]
MIIEWKITKKRGYFRPALHYSVRLEDHEKALALPIVSIVSDIPQPEEDRQDYCYPGLFERAAGYTPTRFYTLEAPSHKGHSWTRCLILPWRAANEYPEVEQSFQRLRDVLEAEIEKADNSQPMNENGSVQTSAAAKVMLAPNLLAERLLRLASNAQAS